MSRAVRAGETIKLRARFKDDLDENAEASGVYVHLFLPEEEDFDLDNAYLVSGAATYLGEGIFEYQFPVPLCATDGTWYDVWEGVLTCQALTSQFTFEVSASGIISEISETQLWQNNLIQLTIPSGIQATDGTYLEDEFEMEFMTVTSPSYTNVRKVQVEAGGFLSGVEEDTIQTAILEASLEAEVLNFRTEIVNQNLFNHARREYVTCAVVSTLLSNLSYGSLRAKTLDNLHVEYDTNGLRDSWARARDCLEKWGPQLMAGGGAKAVQGPLYVVKGEFDPDRPVVARSWQSTEDGGVSRRVPAANSTEWASGYRRPYKTFNRRWW